MGELKKVFEYVCFGEQLLGIFGDIGQNRKNMNKAVGVHIRLCPSLEMAAQKALRLQSPLLHCFFMQQETGQHLRLTPYEIKTFVRDYRPLFSQLFLHGSYLINLSGTQAEHHVLKRELALAKRLSFTHLIVHPGSAKGQGSKEAGIDQLARALNGLLKDEREITFVLENIAQAGLTVGGDLADFNQVLTKIDFPEKLKFCIDTAHAHSYGYDLLSESGRDFFVAHVKKLVGWERVALVHMNDTKQVCGSNIDQHCVLGEGVLGHAVLQALITHPCLQNKPLVLELPELPEAQELALLNTVRDWVQDETYPFSPLDTFCLRKNTRGDRDKKVV